MNKRETVQESRGEKFVNRYTHTHTHTHTHCTGLLPPLPVTPLHTTRVPTARPEANGADRRLTLPPLPASPCEVCVRACVRACVRCVCCVRACARVLRLQSSVKPSLFLCDRSFPFFKKKKINRGACGCRLAHTWFQSIPGCGRQE